MTRRLLSAVLSASVVLSLSTVVAGNASADTTTTTTNAVSGAAPAVTTPASPVAIYTAEQTIPVPPASRYAGSGGGDGWAIALTHDDVYNVFHHNGSFIVACHRQVDATPCYSPKVVRDAAGHSFATPGRPGMWVDQRSGQLYAFATRSDAVDGVVCYDTVAALAGDNPFCGFTPLDAPGEGTAGASSLSSVAVVNGRLYVFNYRSGRPTQGGQNALLCFDTLTKAACSAQPYEIDSGGATAIYGGTWPVGSIAAIGGRIVIPMQTNANARIACFDPAQAQCAGQWPISVNGFNPLGVGTAYPYLTAAGNVEGFCFPVSTGACYDLAGDTLPPPTLISGGIRTNSPWDGPAVVLGPRVYVPNGSLNSVDCYDFATTAACAGFPKHMSNIGLLYSVNTDPQRPTCLWINGDNGGSQIQSFDAYTGGACGSGDVRVLASSFVVPSVLCQPATYTSLQITQPDPSSYTGGSISFEDGDANPIPGDPDDELDGNGTVDLSSRDLSTTTGLPQFVVHLEGLRQALGEVTVKLAWTGVDDPGCALPGTTVVHPVTNHKPVANAGGPYTVAEGGSITLDASASNDQDNDDLTYAWDLDGDKATDSDAVRPIFNAANLDGPSTRTVSLTVCDTSAACDTTQTTVAVTNVAPTAQTAANQWVFRGDDATLTGSWRDPAGAADAPYSWSWAIDGASTSGTTSGVSASATRAYPDAGEHAGTFIVTDKDGGSDTANTRIHVVNRPPVCTSITADSTQLWPPNHKFVPISVSGGSDPDGDPVSLAVVAISQDEPIDSTGDGDTSPDAEGIGTATPSVLAERSGTGDGRVYHLTVRGSDPAGASCFHDVTVAVPHDETAAAADSGVRYDSITGALVDPAAAPTLDEASSVSESLPAVDASTAEDTPVRVQLEADNIGTADVSFAALGAGPGYGTFTAAETSCTMAGDGSRCTATGIYTPAKDFDGSDDFTIVAISGVTAWTTQAHITVTPADDAPNVTVTPANFDMPEDGGPHVVHVAASDVDSPETALTMTIAASPAHGTLFVDGKPWTATTDLPNGLRDVKYEPDADFNGADSFTIAVADDAVPAALTTQTVHVDVRPMNDAPIGDAAEVTTPEDTAIDVPLLATDIDSSSLTFSRTVGTVAGNVGVIADPTCTQVGAGTVCTTTVHYTPAPNASGPVTFNVSVSDGHLTASLPVTVAVTPVNDAPHLTVTPNAVTMNEDASPTSLHLQAGDIETAPADLTFSVSALPAHGTLKLGSKTLTTTDTFAGPIADIAYAPASNYNGDDSFVVAVTDTGDGDSPAITTTQTVPIVVEAVNDPPTTSNVSAQVEEDGSTVITIAGQDIDSNSLRFTTVSAPTSGSLSPYTTSCSTAGTVTTCDATTTYTPKPDANGPDSFVVNVSDGSLNARSNVAVTIRAVNDAPTADADSLLALDAHLVTIDAATLLANDSAGPANESGQHLALTAVHSTDATHGTVSLAGGVVTYTSESGYTGDASFTYSVCDDGTTDGASDPRCATGTVDVTVEPYDNAPAAFDATALTDEDTAVTVTFTAHDIDGDPLTFTAPAPAHGTLSPLSEPVCTTQSDGSSCSATAAYTPAPNYFGSDALAFTASDRQLSDSGSIAVTITPVNDAPAIAAARNPLLTNEDAAVDDVITTSDVETATPDLVVTVRAMPAHGKLSSGGVALAVGDGIPDGTATLRYTPDADFFGTDSFTVAVIDADGATTALVVPVQVAAVNDPPIAGAYDAAASAGATLQIPTSDLTDIASPGPANEAGQPLTITAVTATADTHGTVSLSANTISYAPADGYTGSASFEYTLCDATTDGSTPASLCVTGTAAFNVAVSGPLPTVTGVSPDGAPNGGGTVVTITGANFSGATKVLFGTAPAQRFTVVSDTEITAVAPAGSGAVDLTVVTAAGTSATTNADAFYYPSGGTTSTVSAFLPADGAMVLAPARISADVQAPPGKTISGWSLTEQLLGAHSTAVMLGSGSGALPANLGTFDPTVLVNGTYQLRLTVVDSGGGVSVTDTTVVATGKLKLGRMAATYRDLTIPLGGVPVSLDRSYDSDRSSISGDFGFGWNMGLSDVRVSTNRVLGAGGWSQYDASCVFTICTPGYQTSVPHTVSVTFPDGHVEAFDFTPTGQQQVYYLAYAAYTPRPGTTSTLSPVGDPDLLYQGDENLYDENTGDPYNPTRFVLTEPTGQKFLLDTSNGIVSETLPNGTVLSFSPTGISSSTGGPVLSISRDADGRVTAASGQGKIVRYTYDAAGNLASVTDPVGHVTSYGYDSSHRWTSTIGPDGAKLASYTYTPDGRLASITDAKGNVTTLSVDVAGRQETVTDQLGRRITVETFDDFGDPIREDVTADGKTRTTTSSFDAYGHLLSTTDPLGNTTSYSYDANFNLVGKTDAAGKTTSFSYDTSNRLTSVTDAAGNVVGFGYNDSNELTRLTDALGHATANTYNSLGLLATSTDPDGNTTTYAYDDAGNVTSVTDPLGHTTSYTYDPLGHLASATDELGATTTYSIDAIGEMVSRTDPLGATTNFNYDDYGHLLSMTDPLGHTTSYTYDPLGHLATVTDPLGDTTSYGYDADEQQVSQTDAMGATTAYGYDGFGDATTVTDPLGHTTSYGYDAGGRITSLTDALDGAVHLGYDAFGNVVSEIDPTGVRTTFSYDPVGNLVSQTDAAGNTKTFSYNGDGTLASSTNARGETTRYTYDPAGNLVGRTSPSGNGSFAYDAAGDLTRMVDATGTTNFGYDAAGRLTSATPPQGGLAYGYDAVGQRTSVTADGQTTGYAYDLAGQLTTLTDPTGGLTAYSYDAAGDATRVAYPNGIAIANGFDGDGHLVSIDAEGASGTVVSRAYSIDAAGNVTAVTTPEGVENFRLDADNRLVADTLPNGSVVSYGYDAAGNRTSRADATGSTAYTYNQLGQLATATGPSGSTSFSYNADGDLLAAGDVAFSYDSADTLTAITAAGATTDFTVNGLGQRVAATTSGATTTYLPDQAEPIALPLTVGDTAIVRDPYGNPIGRTDTGGTAYTIGDDENSVLASTDATGALIGSASYDPFGTTTATSGGTGPLGYTGALTDPSGLVDLTGREYNPALGVFLQPDTLLVGGPGVVGFNRYAYATDNPTTYTDPTGHQDASLAGQAADEEISGELDEIEDSAGEQMLCQAESKAAEVVGQAVGHLEAELAQAVEQEAADAAETAAQQAITNTLKTAVDQAREKLIANPALAARYVSEGRWKATLAQPWLTRMTFGHALEEMVAQDPNVGTVLRHVGIAGNPDFVGESGLGYEVTTSNERTVAEHLRRGYVDAGRLATYKPVPSTFRFCE